MTDPRAERDAEQPIDEMHLSGIQAYVGRPETQEEKAKRSMFCNTLETRDVLEHIARERLRQDTKWGEQNHPSVIWMCILLEEIGEIATAVLREYFAKGVDETRTVETVRLEAVQSAAVLTAMVECLDRNKPHAAAPTSTALGERSGGGER